MSTDPRTAGAPRALTVAHLVQPVDGGVARAVADLVRAQTGAGTRAVVLCPPGGRLARDVRAAGAGVRLWLAGRGPGADLPWEVLCAARLLGRLRPDVVHLHSAEAGLAGRLALRGRVPTVLQPHAWSFQALTGPAAAAARRWERYAARWTGRFLCVSEAERAEGERAGVRGRYAVVPNGVDPARHPVAGSVDRRQARAALAMVHGLPQRAPLVVCVGRLTRQKGQDVLLRAWPRVAARVPGARLALVGEGPEGAALRRAAGPGVLLAGHSDDTRPWYAAADVVVQPSRWEGMALAPLEAMAAGRPVVLTDVGGARESLPDGHAPHCLVPPESPDALGDALVALLADAGLRRRLGERAAGHVREAHDVRRAADACARVYRELTSVVAPRVPDDGERARR
ncbi:glycosyltransferase family 4 protein [Streptomyces sp. RFCAC02]|uniref:glycosyltransferase family 4 protein n=1 Tax=Streptomyces sp. RFCAC02 TaxID=2499143 RepID=UPI001021DDEB|nr:glycosyltransferase family 4 protein [Streptomyces sp. RFCAC02]